MLELLLVSRVRARTLRLPFELNMKDNLPMFKSPLVLGIDGVQQARHGRPLEGHLSALGNNSGNMIFSEGLYHSLDNARRGSYHFTHEMLEGCDCIVIAAANWVNPSSDFGNLATRLEALKLPIFMSGLGAQSSLDKTIPDMKPGTERLIRLVSERSTSISVRGHFSADVLAAHGIHNVTVTGCPSLLYMGPNGAKIRRPENLTAADCVVHGTRHLFESCDALQRYFYTEAFRQKLDLLLQSELADSYYALGHLNDPQIIERCDGVLKKVFNIDDANQIANYLHEHGKMFLDFENWLKYAASKKFCLGTRIHGTIASLMAGTPAVLVTHDSRTLEMAQAMNIPFVRHNVVDTKAPLDVPSFFKETDLQKFERGYSSYYANFMEFFAHNNLPVAASHKVQTSTPI